MIILDKLTKRIRHLSREHTKLKSRSEADDGRNLTVNERQLRLLLRHCPHCGAYCGEPHLLEHGDEDEFFVDCKRCRQLISWSTRPQSLIRETDFLTDADGHSGVGNGDEVESWDCESFFGSTASLLSSCSDKTLIDANMPPLWAELLLVESHRSPSMVENPCHIVDRDHFSMITPIGEGQFGRVFKGILNLPDTDRRIRIAVKTTKNASDKAQYRNLFNEYTLLEHMAPHVNVVSLLGVCTSNGLHLLMEFCEYGSLLAYLIKNPVKEENPSLLVGFAYQLARGVKHLASQKIVHRDLALRNLLLTSQYIVKISDFGLSFRAQPNESPPRTMDDPVPLRWMAIETLTEPAFSEKSDVWSFGVVLWEMYTCGDFPYRDERIDCSHVRELLDWLKQGHRLAKPSISTKEIYDLMLACWHEDPSRRPSFSACKRRLGQMVEDISPDAYAVLSSLDSIVDTSASDKQSLASSNVDVKSASPSSIWHGSLPSLTSTIPYCDPRAPPVILA